MALVVQGMDSVLPVNLFNAGVAQSVERLFRKEQAIGSTPVISFLLCKLCWRSAGFVTRR